MILLLLQIYEEFLKEIHFTILSMYKRIHCKTYLANILKVFIN